MSAAQRQAVALTPTPGWVPADTRSLLIARATSGALVLAPWVVALAFALWALRGVEAGGVVLTDAARHAMNGALIHDWIARGAWSDPVAYATRYYGFWPALSIPYHPPLFPALEALAYFAFGVTGFSARLMVAIATGFSVVLLWRLLRPTHPPAVALAVVVTFFSMPPVQRLSQDVMLELPALAFTLGALLTLPLDGAPWNWRRGAAFGLLAAAAIWTKQQTVFLAAVPLLFAVATRQRAWWSSPGCWLASLFPVVAFAGLELLGWASGEVPLKRLAPIGRLLPIIADNTLEYVRFLRSSLGYTLLVAFAVGSVGYLLRSTKSGSGKAPDALVWVWLLATVTVVLPGMWRTDRYLFFIWLPMLAIAAAGLFRLCCRVTTPRLAACVVAGAAILHAGVQLNASPSVLRGPTEVARRLAPAAERVLYCGDTNGQFIFALRSAAGRPDGGNVVIRCDKLPPRALSRNGLRDFARAYGVGHVVVERTETSQPWDHLWDAPPKGMLLEEEVPLEGSVSGALRVYRFQGRAGKPVNELIAFTEKIGDKKTRMRLDWSRLP